MSKDPLQHSLVLIQLRPIQLNLYQMEALSMKKTGKRSYLEKRTRDDSDSGSDVDQETPEGGGLFQEFVLSPAASIDNGNLSIYLPFQKTSPCPRSVTCAAKALTRRGRWICPPSSSWRILTAVMFLWGIYWWLPLQPDWIRGLAEDVWVLWRTRVYRIGKHAITAWSLAKKDVRGNR